METSKNNPLTLPMAIVIAGLLIAGAIFVRGNETSPSKAVEKGRVAVQSPPVLGALTLNPVDETRDHIRGNPGADIVFVEFSDTECPFCKRFHATMQQVINEYGKSGKVAWVYRQFPIVQLHSRAPKESEAMECAAEVGGNAKFWEYADRLFAVTNSNNSLDPGVLPQIATEVGLNKTSFTDCLSSGRTQARIKVDQEDGRRAGINGTPHSILVLKNPISEKGRKAILDLMEQYRDPEGNLPVEFSLDGLRVSLNGALPFPIIKTTIEAILK